MSNSTPRDLITGALRLLGVAAEGESISAPQANDALDALNALLETLNLDRLMIYTINRTVYPLVIGTQSYTLGTGGTLGSTRPVRIESASVSLNTNTLEIPINVLRYDEWQAIAVKGVDGSFPLNVYPDNGNPLNTLYFWPIPSASCSVVLYTWNQLTAFSTLDDSVAWPPGYYRALRYMLARELAPEYGIEASPTVQSIADSSKEWLRKINWTPGVIRVDDALMGSHSSIARQSRGLVVDP